MSRVIHAQRKELSASEIIELVEDGSRVVLEMAVLGYTSRVVIRHHEGQYYCDTPLKLMRLDTANELKTCLERFRMTRRESTDDRTASAVTP